MRKVVGALLVLVLSMGLVLVDSAYARKTPAEFCEYKGTVHVYIEDIANSTGNDRIDVADLRKQFENIFKADTDYKFIIVNNPEDADAIMNVDIVKYYWTESDPLDVPSIYGLVADAAIKEPYVRMDAVIRLRTPRSNMANWKERVIATITGQGLTEETSYEVANKRMAKMFIKELFDDDRRGFKIH